MFTGIIEEVGTIRFVSLMGSSGKIAIEAQRILEGTKIGDSIAVNGVCLTVVSLQRSGFTADIMAETIRRSSLGRLRTGDWVNLERAMAAQGRFGGHLVSGHIDGTGVIKAYQKEENAVWMSIEAGPEILKLIVEKGSVCIDGVSLTVAETAKDAFLVSVIPHTGSETTLLEKRPGDVVNVENDMIGKYVRRLLGFTETEVSPKDRKAGNVVMFKDISAGAWGGRTTGGGITMESLKEYLDKGE